MAPPEWSRSGRRAHVTHRFTDKQGQYLAFIRAYSVLHSRPPAEADMVSFFGVTPPSVHQMIIELERRGFIHRKPRQPRSVELAIDPSELPPLREQPIKTTASRD